MTTIALDMTGGDNAPESCINGALLALSEEKNIHIRMYGPEEVLLPLLEEHPEADMNRITVVDCREVIGQEEHPVDAVRRKKDSSIVRAVTDVKNGEARAFVSAGSTGAVLAAGQLRLGRLKNVLRPPLAMLIPTTKGVSLFLDCGANVDARPEWLVQYAVMGSLYMEHVAGVPSPSVKLVNIGTEESKGNGLIKETAPLFENLTDINYQGFIESREIPFGGADVVVTDAFTGNALLKMYEGVSAALMGQIKTTLRNGSLGAKLGALLIKKDLKGMLKTFDASSYGGAPMLGLKGLVVKCHGNAGDSEIKNALLQCMRFSASGLEDRIVRALETETVVSD